LRVLLVDAQVRGWCGTPRCSTLQMDVTHEDVDRFMSVLQRPEFV